MPLIDDMSDAGRPGGELAYWTDAATERRRRIVAAIIGAILGGVAMGLILGPLA